MVLIARCCCLRDGSRYHLEAACVVGLTVTVGMAGRIDWRSEHEGWRE